MGFDGSAGTRGGSQPTGLGYRLLNVVMTPFIRRRGSVGGMNALLLTTVGRKTGKERTLPVNWFPGSDGSWLIVASAAGAVSNPSWYYNIKANPDKVRVEIDGRSIPVHPEQLSGSERDEAWRMISVHKRFSEYQEKTDRQLPIIRLTARR
ncbi:nitroreductase family deazaflavin-dependent oxidoreductase [Mycobacterium sp. TNTM28]|uniref:Nitroreductase family deazaflavin-dependent oxidoreductase n=1 Tax=[Mycobacterium] fortunisiensis TaxID=2600579 RepID=A0ABS6KNM9_9MYCO|nr:nitroreductase family deazaflavin-dependent oxidoreductase [[Mycobacterium] fortunisiensis]MBU9765125.1 nitroreductase family deazaflavin-dependent oxidoreductase [[Mycobacterium] fortunisiensis]